MSAIETTGTVDDDRCHLTLHTPLPEMSAGEVKIIVQFEDQPAPPRKVDFTAALGAYYREFPKAPRRSTAEWMDDLRGGDRGYHALI